MNRLVYLAGPVDLVTDDEASTWRGLVTEKLRAANVVAYWPNLAANGPYDVPVHLATSKALRVVHRAALDVCPVVLARFLPAMGLGTVREVEYARAAGKTVIVHGDPDALLRSHEAHDLSWSEDLDDCVQVAISTIDMPPAPVWEGNRFVQFGHGYQNEELQ